MCVRGGGAVGVSHWASINPSVTHCICGLTSHNLEEFLFREQLTCREVVGGMPMLNDAPGELRLQLQVYSVHNYRLWSEGKSQAQPQR